MFLLSVLDIPEFWIYNFKKIYMYTRNYKFSEENNLTPVCHKVLCTFSLANALNITLDTATNAATYLTYKNIQNSFTVPQI
jgi:hypothetical protein